MALVDQTATVARVVLDHPECVPVFRAHRIDFCCRGEVTLEEACASKGLDPGTVLSQLESAVRERVDAGLDPRDAREEGPEQRG